MQMQALSLAITAPDFAILLATVVVAGLVRGFSGFGTAMVFLPVAGRILDPFSAILVLVVMDLVGPLPLVPRAFRDGDLKEIGWIFAAMALTLPVGLSLLSMVDPEVFRWAVSLTIFLLLVLLIGGFRHSLPFTPPTLISFGAVSGVLGGLSGLAGPPIVLLYLASTRATEVIRANTLLYLISVDIALIALFLIMDRFELSALWTGLALFPAYALAGLVGQRLFDPDKASLYRRVAYGIVAIAALQGLPIWDGLM